MSGTSLLQIPQKKYGDLLPQLGALSRRSLRLRAGVVAVDDYGGQAYGRWQAGGPTPSAVDR